MKLNDKYSIEQDGSGFVLIEKQLLQCGTGEKQEMNNKCDWKDGKFIGCSIHNEIMGNGGSFMYFGTGNKTYIASFCPSCGAYIRKPEPEKPMIVKSGETWAKYEEGENYLWTNDDFQPPEISGKSTENGAGYVMDIRHYWKPFSEIEKEGLTDEVAKLRPMVMIKNDNGFTDNRMLTYIDEDYVQCKGATYSRSIIDASESVRLATPHELQGAE